MNRIRVICLLIALCLLLACVSTEKPTETSSEPEETASMPSLTDAQEAALLYIGEQFRLYCGRSETELGVIIEKLRGEETPMLYQPLPGTEGAERLHVSEIRSETDENGDGERLILRYADAEGQERALCIERSFTDVYSYPLCDAADAAVAEDRQSAFGDVMLIGYLYEHFRSDYAKKYSDDDWESLCQRRILDALYYNYGYALPPYLCGEPYGDAFYHNSFVTTAELDGFFRSVIDRPNLVPDRMYIDEEVPELQPGQVPMWPTDWVAWTSVRQAVPVSDGEYLLYGYAHIGNLGFYPQGVICHVTAADGYLGWRVLDTEIIPRPADMEKSGAVFVPAA